MIKKAVIIYVNIKILASNFRFTLSNNMQLLKTIQKTGRFIVKLDIDLVVSFFINKQLEITRSQIFSNYS